VKVFADLPEHFSGDMQALGLFALLVIALIAFGIFFIDLMWKKVHFSTELAKGNMAVAVVIVGIALSISYAITNVAVAIIRPVISP